MKNIKTSILPKAGLLLLFLWASPHLFAQKSQSDDPNCSITSGTIENKFAFFNYGGSVKMKTSTRRMKMTIGQPFVGFAADEDGTQNATHFGFWTRLLVAPLPPIVTATQGELLDRIQISWAANPLGSLPTNGFKIYRDGFFLAAVDKNTRTYLDFNVIAGKNYTYEVRGTNLYGEGAGGTALGFQVPNGVATGWVRTINGNPVPGAQVTLSPMQGYSMRLNEFDGAIARAHSSTGGHFLPTTGSTDWSITFWAKMDGSVNTTTGGITDILAMNNLAMRTNTGFASFVMQTSPGVYDNMNVWWPGGVGGGWQHFALTYAGGQYRLYLNGELVEIKNGLPILASPEINFGSNNPTDGWIGNLDEIRIYHRRLDELDLREVMAGTASTLTPNLKYYWKMDEGAGKKSFDIINRNPLSFCGAIFDSNRPPVATSGVTNADGYYRIEGANYGTGTTFLATPKKDFYKHRALKFIASEGDYATLPDFAVAQKATIEIWANQDELTGNKVLLSKRWGSNHFLLQSVNDAIWLTFNGLSSSLGTWGVGYHHVALTFNTTPGNTTITVFKDGNLVGPHSFPQFPDDWTDPTQPWVVGALQGLYGVPAGQFGYFYGGLIDEVAVYDTILTQSQIAAHVSAARDPQEKHLSVYFAFDEGSSTKLSNSGSALVDGTGTTYGTEWTTLAKNQETVPHVFLPATRQVTLNPSVTSVDQVDFIDRSTVAVSGFVRYANTDCFANQVEILVNGETYNPIALTDSTGKFTIDLEPGTSVTLRPKFKDHEFFPEEIELTNIVAPIAGIVFNDITTREINVQVAGGDCKKSIISNPGTPTGTVCTVTVRTTDGCFEKQHTFTTGEEDGIFQFENIPPLELTVAVTEHSDPLIKTGFQVQGGVQIDLTEKQDTALEFIYYAPPTIELSGLDPYSDDCDLIVLEQYTVRNINIKVKEIYYNNEVCYLDTAAIKLVNGFEDSVRLLTLNSVAGINYIFRVGKPIGAPPHMKTLQVVATNLEGNESQITVQGLVTGINNKHNTFTSTLPTVPTLVLHDPPGDGSYAFLEKNQEVCQQVKMDLDYTVGGGTGVLLHLGGFTETVVAPFGVGGEFDAELLTWVNVEANFSYQKVSSNVFETCTSFSERISTGDNQLIVGSEQGGDVYVGTAMNVDFGFADLVTLDTNNCVGVVQTVLNVEPGKYPTTFMYSEWGVRENIIRFLDSLIIDPNALPADTLQYHNSKVLWQKFISDNKKMRDTVTAQRNISFEAGAMYEYSTTSDTLTAAQEAEIFNTSGGVHTNFGFTFIGLGIETQVNFDYALTKGKTKGGNTQKGITVGYTLADDDMLDMFSVDVGIDPRFKTPIFRTKAGQSSCPWEPKTAHREGNSMQFRDGSGPVALDVPSNGQAAFLLTLGNESETNETFTYYLGVGPESNPHGAKISVNGAPLDVPLLYAIPWEERSLPVTVTVERGPVEYNYDSLEVVFYSLCEDERATALGIKPDDDQVLYSPQYITVHFIKPCSEVEITVPEQGWVIHPDNLPDNENIRRITVSGYDKSNSDFEKIRVQYRRSNGDGAWINIPGPASGGNPDQDNTGAIVRDDLGNVFTQFYWDTDGLADDEYEIRAVSICSGNVADLPGYSHIIKGRIERQPPSLIGTPEPSDGVYQVGDEISFSFNKDINCSALNGVDNVQLWDATTGLAIDIDITCKDNKIFLDPNFQNEFFENRILRAELHDIRDLTGNSMDSTQWEFYVDRNELAWLTDSLGMTKNEDETKSVTASIHNRGGYPVPFEIQNVPNWVRVVPNVGTLAANEVRAIRFEVDSVLPFGHWTDTVVLHTVTGQNPFFMGGDEGLPFGVRVVCRPPDWEFDPQQFTNSMNMVLKLDIGGQFSSDVEDKVVAWLGDTIVGRANVEYVPQTGSHLVFLTVYGDASQVMSNLRLEIWDASACLRYEVLETSFAFQPDVVVGTPTAPQVLHTTSNVLRDVPIGSGWNWLSFNLAFPDPALNPALASLNRPQNDYIKSQTQFAEYSGSAWLGSLTALNNTKMFVYRADQPDTLLMSGTLLDPAATPIAVTSGWNWIGYVPQYPLPINDALGSLGPAAGDLIKSQTEFAQYVSPAFGWVGNLKYMAPPQGYQLKLAAPGSIVYPPPSANRPVLESAKAASDRSQLWTVDETLFEHSSTLVGMLRIGEANATAAQMEIGAFVGGEVRGAARAIYVEPYQCHLFFLTMYANTGGEKVEFKIFDPASGTVGDLNETVLFSPNQHQGSLAAPFPFTPASTGGSEAFQNRGAFEVRPNPFRGETNFRFALPTAQEVVLSIVDLNGRTVSEERFFAAEGLSAHTWKASTESGERLPAGVYFARLETADGTLVRKMVLQQ